MEIGVTFPQTEIGADPGGIRAYAEAAQALGYRHVVAADHVLGADPAGHPGWDRPFTHQSMLHEPFALFAFIAAVAPGLGVAPSVIILPQRQTALVAKQAAEVDILTNGKLRLGVGIGWNPVEYEALGMDFRDRARRFEEQIDLMRRLWTEPVVTYRGAYHAVTAAGINPLPVQRPIPIWVGASAEAAVRRACRMADGYMPLRPLAGGWEATMEKVRGWLREAGREPASFGIEARLNAQSGTPDAWARELEMWRGLGATHVSVNTTGGGLSGPDAHIRRLREVAEALGL